MDSSLLSGEKKVARANLANDAHRRKGTSKNAGNSIKMTLLTSEMTVRQW
ncbi:hypothetical protein [Pseudomonas fluorescens]|nr:hypothetical protein [Pseudomonas fluorescens]